MPQPTGLHQIEATALDNHGFYTTETLAHVAADDATRLHLVLIRWHEGRVLVAAQYADALIRALDSATPPWTVRDVSQPTDDSLAGLACHRARHGAARLYSNRWAS